LKNLKLIITSTLLFVIINTTYFWEKEIGIFYLPVFLIIVSTFIYILISLFKLIKILIRNKFSDKKTFYSSVYLTFLFTLIIIKPFGLINYEEFEAEDVLIVKNEGAANCNTTLNFKKDNSFKEITFCFGLSEISGTYIISNDTIYFKELNRIQKEKFIYEFGVIQELKNYSEKPLGFILYKNKQDTIGNYFNILKNNLEQ
jgi:uncharacterized membrane protein